MGPAAGRIADSPGALFPDVKLSCGQEMHQRRNDVVLNDSLQNVQAVSQPCTMRGPAREQGKLMHEALERIVST